MFKNCSNCGKSIGFFGGGEAAAEDLEQLHKAGIIIPEPLCYACSQKYLNQLKKPKQPFKKTSYSQQTDRNTETVMTKKLGMLMLFVAGVLFLISFAMGIAYKALVFSASVFLFILGAILTAIGINADKILQQNEEILRILRTKDTTELSKDPNPEQTSSGETSETEKVASNDNQPA